MKSKFYVKINVYVFRILLYLAFGCTTAMGQDTKSSRPDLLNESTSHTASNQPLMLFKNPVNVKPIRLKKRTKADIINCVNPLRIGLVDTHFSSNKKNIDVKSGIVYYTLKNPLKRLAGSNNLTPIGISVVARF